MKTHRTLDMLLRKRRIIFQPDCFGPCVDLPVATDPRGGADAIFAKKGRALERVCRETGVAHRPFDDFTQVHAEVQALLDQWDRESTAKI